MNVEQLLLKKQVSFKTQGSDCVVCCLNPDHEDIHPSMRIDRVTGIFNCFSCGFRGNIFKHFGIEQNIVDITSARIKKKIEALLGNIVLELPENAIPVEHDYKGISKKTLLEYEAFTITGVPMLEERIVFPIRNLNGHIKAFCARRMFSDADPKYVFYPKNTVIPVFPAKPEIIDGSIILVEGIFDALNLIEKGLPNAVCAFGTEKLLKENTLGKVNYFNILGVIKIYIMFDGDESGQKAAKETEAALKKKFSVERIELPEDRDPGDLVYEEVNTIRESLYESRAS